MIDNKKIEEAAINKYGKVYRANITNVLPFEIEGEYIIEEPVIVENK